MEFGIVSGGGVPFVASTSGQGPDVVLLHGFPDTPHAWSGIRASLLDAGWRVTVPWLRGYHADAIVPGRGYDPETLGRDALALLDGIGAQRAVVVGHDWGALLAYVAASLAPERISAIVTFGIPHPSQLWGSPRTLWAGRHFVALKMPGAASLCRRQDFAYLDTLYRRWAPGWSGPERDERLAAAKRALAPEATLEGAISYYRDNPLRPVPILAKVPKLPGLIVGGTEDGTIASMFERTASLMGSGSRAVIAQGAGHWPHLERPALVQPAMLQFLAEIKARGV